MPPFGPTGHGLRVRLRRAIAEGFDPDLVPSPCFELGVPHDDLPGQAHTNRSRELILYLARRNRLGDLVAADRRVQPTVDWYGVVQGEDKPVTE